MLSDPQKLHLTSVRLKNPQSTTTSELTLRSKRPPITHLSRLPTISVRRIKGLDWPLNGATGKVKWINELIDNAIDQVPGLLNRADLGILPHDQPIEYSVGCQCT